MVAVLLVRVHTDQKIFTTRTRYTTNQKETLYYNTVSITHYRSKDAPSPVTKTLYADARLTYRVTKHISFFPKGVTKYTSW